MKCAHRLTRLLCAAGLALLILCSAALPAAALSASAANPAGTSAPAESQTDANGTDTHDPAASSDPNSDSAQTPAEPQTGATVRLDEVTTWLDEKGTLKVAGTIEAHTDIANPQLTLSMSTRTLDSVTLVAGWRRSPTDYRPIGGNSDLGEDLPDQLAAGTTTSFAFELKPKDAGLSSSDSLASWGARGLRLDLDGVSDYLTTADPLTAFTTWYPDPNIEKTRLTGIIPVTHTGFDSAGLIPQEELEGLVTDGALKHVRSALEAQPEAVVALDPRILAAVEAVIGAEALRAPLADNAQGGGAASSSPGSESAAPDGGSMDNEGDHQEPTASPDQAPAVDDWWQGFARLLSDREIIALPYADANTLGLSQAGQADAAAAAWREADLITELFPQTSTDWEWPAPEVTNAADLVSLTQMQKTGVILEDLQLPSATSYTVSAPTRLTVTSAENGTVTSGSKLHAQNPDLDDPADMPGIDAIVTDSALTAAAANLIHAQPQDVAVQRSELVALSATITSERPFDPRSLAFALPRTDATPAWGDVTSALGGLPWLENSSFEKLLQSTAGPRETFVQGTEANRSGSLDAEFFAARDSLSGYASVFTEPENARRDFSRMALTCTSTAYAKDMDSSDCTHSFQTAAGSLTGGLEIERGSNVLLVTGEETTIPVTVQNNTGREVAIRVHLKPATPQLQASDSELATIPAGQSARLSVPVKGLANADVNSTLSIRAADGYIAQGTQPLTVNVRADWENIGTAVVGTALGLVFIVGLIFTVKRGRPKIPESQLAAALARAKE